MTTTSYVILGLLALRRWSTYELAQQMRRSIRYYWPRAESHLYEEPKKLVALGLATATREDVGRRPRTVYEITDAGREALREWLATPGSTPLVEFDGLVKVLFAEQGTKEQLLATLATIRADAESTRLHHAELAADLVETGGPFPDRLHVNSLVFAFMWQQAEAVLRWAEWAEGVVAAWPDTSTQPPAGPLEEAAREASRTPASPGSRRPR
ncbi:PadR family transcriptional regulator [Lentzea sp. NBRC 105346]|uniref:PadR family transcriptional regulator n=1 Tax=Lentzea sp. NBRC 105346 TaxID=3032205 RepID=UPI00255438EA|nr:PadR family transcriptional regulator [Lentzea sp. NBRC 105346]